ncbi:unnamed protein product [Protopolystoma xenopodis]|uniref:Uncharacterized protein n=1 Tax=Protopolystoma xenopodis TaxID=117903 RepID=A0A448XSE7_9PLAT|nr:unnamed protein product [Protopolystoma xenopodis]
MPLRARLLSTGRSASLVRVQLEPRGWANGPSGRVNWALELAHPTTRRLPPSRRLRCQAPADGSNGRPGRGWHSREEPSAARRPRGPEIHPAFKTGRYAVSFDLIAPIHNVHIPNVCICVCLCACVCQVNGARLRLVMTTMTENIRIKVGFRDYQ